MSAMNWRSHSINLGGCHVILPFMCRLPMRKEIEARKARKAILSVQHGQPGPRRAQALSGCGRLNSPWKCCRSTNWRACAGHAGRRSPRAAPTPDPTGTGDGAPPEAAAAPAAGWLAEPPRAWAEPREVCASLLTRRLAVSTPHTSGVRCAACALTAVGCNLIYLQLLSGVVAGGAAPTRRAMQPCRRSSSDACPGLPFSGQSDEVVEANFQIARSRLPLLRRGPAWVIGVQLVSLVAAYLLPALVVELGAAMVARCTRAEPGADRSAEIAAYERWMDVLVIPAVGLGLLAFGWWLARVASAQGVGPDTAVLVRRPWVRRLAAVGLAGLAVALRLRSGVRQRPSGKSWLRDLHRPCGPGCGPALGRGPVSAGHSGDLAHWRGAVLSGMGLERPARLLVTAGGDGRDGFIFLVAAASANRRTCSFCCRRRSPYPSPERSAA